MKICSSDQALRATDFSGGYGYYGFAGKQSTINATLGSNIGSIAQADLNAGDTAGTAVAEAGLHDAQQAAQGTATGNAGSVLEPAKWGSEIVTYSLADAPVSNDTPFSGYLSSQYDALVEQAFATWGAASGITFEEVSDSSQSDIRVGFSDLNTASSGVVGYRSGRRRS